MFKFNPQKLGGRGTFEEEQGRVVKRPTYGLYAQKVKARPGGWVMKAKALLKRLEPPGAK